MASTSLESREIDLASAKELLARLERYAANQRAASPQTFVASVSPSPTLLPRALPGVASQRVATAPVTRWWIPPTTIDLFPYDLVAVIVACAATIMLSISFGRPTATGVGLGLIAIGESARRLRWLPSLGVNLIIGTLIGVLLIFTA